MMEKEHVVVKVRIRVHIYIYIYFSEGMCTYFFHPHPIAARSLLHHHLSSVRNVVRDLQAAPLINGWCSFSLGFLLEGPLPFLQSRGRAQQRKQTVHESWKSKRQNKQKNVPHFCPGNSRPYPDFLGCLVAWWDFCPSNFPSSRETSRETLNSLVD